MSRPADPFRRERAVLLGLARDWDEPTWNTPSRAAGWRVRDVVAHLGAGCHALFTPSMLTLLRSDDVERTNDAMVDERRAWPTSAVLAEYDRWSSRAAAVAGLVVRTPLARARLPLAELGRFRADLLLLGATTFDLHTHLRHDIAPALGITPPPTDDARMAWVLDWMFAVLSQQLVARPERRPRGVVTIALDGPGATTRHVDPAGAVHAGPAPAPAATVRGRTVDFPDWGTTRSPWREHDVVVAVTSTSPRTSSTPSTSCDRAQA